MDSAPRHIGESTMKTLNRESVMKRIVSTSLCLGAALYGLPATPAAAADKPNVLLILADDKYCQEASESSFARDIRVFSSVAHIFRFGGITGDCVQFR
jgi:hypothetical protein